MKHEKLVPIFPYIPVREREIQIVHSASLAYEDESVFTFCALLRMAVRQWLTAF